MKDRGESRMRPLLWEWDEEMSGEGGQAMIKKYFPLASFTPDSNERKSVSFTFLRIAKINMGRGDIV